MVSQGFQAPFLDFDKHSGIPPGTDWEKRLYEEIDRSQALLILQTANWSSSKWCFVEFTQARALGKPIFQVIEDDSAANDAPIAPNLQRSDLRHDREGGLDSLRTELIRIALDGQGGFQWPPPDEPNRLPFPGLLVFEEPDAAIYFGRNEECQKVIERLRTRKTNGGPRLLVLQGPSGSGKSSLLRAGVLPRLKRAGKQWLVLPPVRPKSKPLQELSLSLAVALQSPKDDGLSDGDSSENDSLQWYKKLENAARKGTLAALLEELTFRLRGAAKMPEANILLPIDQGEELFGVAEPEEAQGFLKFLAEAVSAPYLPIQVLLTIRADAMNELLSVPFLRSQLEEVILIGPMPMERYGDVIRGPARVADLTVDEEFVAQAVRDTETKDALPLLAVALSDLYNRFGQDGRLSVAAYRSMGDVEWETKTRATDQTS